MESRGLESNGARSMEGNAIASVFLVPGDRILIVRLDPYPGDFDVRHVGDVVF